MAFKIYVGIVLIIFIVVVSFIIIDDNEPGVDQTYLLPKGFEGCVVINYDVKGAEPLKVKNNEIVYKVPSDGIINTSSPMEFGWVNKEESGSYQLKAYYVGKNGERLQELPSDKIRFGANGTVQEHGKPERDYYYQIFGSKKTEDKGCHHSGIL
ncbi:hypothetical protein U8V72_27565 [Priestia filamentosa]|uniref:DUF6843 domain-containing protein n=1 Tax=Priestia filamentosa TaxID=1402861 RepID=UPI00397BF241